MFSSFYRCFARAKALFFSHKLDRDFDLEVENHIKLLIDENINQGIEPYEAERLARIRFGGVSQLREAHRDVRSVHSLDTFLQDVRYTFRIFRRNAGFTLFIILIVGLGVGASSTIFSVVNTLLLRPLPFEDSKQLIWIANRSDDGVSEWSTQVDHFLDLREQNRSFSDIAAYCSFWRPGDAKLTEKSETQRLNSLRVSQNFFGFLGVHPFLGRTFSVDEASSRWNSPRAVILSYDLWKRRFNAAQNIVGRSVTLNDAPVTIVGVMPPSFDFAGVLLPGNHFDFYLPMPLTSETNAWGNLLAVIGRLKPGVSIQSAQREMAILGAQIEKHHPERNSLRPILSSLDQHVMGSLRRAMVVLAGAVGIVMLLVCANVANLQLARGASRQKEMAVRAALGAGQRRLVRQLLTESVILSCCGGLVGILLAFAGTGLLARLDAFNIPLLASVKLDASSLVFAVLLAILTGLVFGLVPAFQVTFNSVQGSLKDNSRSSSPTKNQYWVRNALVVSEIVFACVLLVGAALLARSFLKVLQVNIGFQSDRVAAMRIDHSVNYASRSERDKFFDRVLNRVRSLPGVECAGLTDVLPLAGDRSWGISAKGKTYAAGHYPEGFIRMVGDDYIRTMGIPLISGRVFTEQDDQLGEPVVVVNETLARTVWPNENPIGQILICEANSPGRRVVGIVGDVRHRGMEQAPGCELYIPLRQTDDVDTVYLVVCSVLPPSSLASSIRAALHPIAPDLAANEFRVVQDIVGKAISPRRFVVSLVAGFATFALIIAALGIYAVISYSVNQRTTELGIRMALGASIGKLQLQVLAQTLLFTGIGLLLGGIGGWFLSRALKALLFGVAAADPIAFFGAGGVLTAAAAIAGYLPTLRISKIDPMVALRANQ